MADFDRSYHHHPHPHSFSTSYSSSSSYAPRLSTDQQNPSRPSTDHQQPSSYSSFNTYEYNGRMDMVPRHQPPLPPVPVPPRQVAVVGSSGGPWCFGDPEMKRKRRVASYKAYSVEGKVKASLRNGFRWIKVKCSEIIHGW